MNSNSVTLDRGTSPSQHIWDLDIFWFPEDLWTSRSYLWMSNSYIFMYVQFLFAYLQSLLL
jgi:hypothetical protein